MKRFLGATVAIRALALNAASTTAATHHSCGSLGGEFLHIRTKPPGWRRTDKKASRTNTNVTCKNAGGEVVAYTYHV
jgi:hypothetical protein